MTVSVRRVIVPGLEEARRELSLIGADSCGIELMATKMLHHTLLVKRVACREANILKQEALSVGGDAAVARGTVGCSIPATDVLLMGTQKQLSLLCGKLAAQPFGLPELARRIGELLQPPRPVAWDTGRRLLDLSSRPLIMGILNVTPDSFSDGSRYLDPRSAVDRGLQMEQEGADIIDIGGESTRPYSPPVDEEEERRRVLPVLEELASRLTIPLSIDTYKASVARRALAAGAEIVNDISGFTFDEGMAAAVSSAGAGAVLMHTRGRPAEMQDDTSYADLVSEVYAYLERAVAGAEEAGIAPAKIVVDPGFGFAKSGGGNLQLLRRISELSSLGKPLLIGLSRKSFTGTVGGRRLEDRLFSTAAAVALATAEGASILRVHDVKEMRDAADMAWEIYHNRPR